MATSKKTAVLDAEKPEIDPGLTTVKLFDCEVRLSGDILHSQVRYGITNGEIRVIRAIHGEAGVVKITPAGEAEVNEKEELYRLAVKYSKDIDPRTGVKLVERVFGVPLDGFEEWNNEREMGQEAVRRARRAKEQEESARFARAREAAEARVRSDLAAERV